MQTVLLVLHLMIAAALIGVVLLQKSEGGALGIGGGGGGGFLTGRGQANLLTRVTAGLALAFFTTSILLSILSRPGAPQGSVLDKLSDPAPASSSAPASTTTPAPGTAPAAPGSAPATGGEAPAAGAPAQPRGGVLDKLQ